MKSICQHGIGLGLIITVSLGWAQPAQDPCQSFNDVPENSSQIMVVTPIKGVRATVSLCQRHKGDWRRQGPVLKAVIGKQGIAAHGGKKEGDAKTPEGIFPIGTAFGTHPIAVKMDYKYITPFDKFVDDVSSEEYNQWVVGATTAKSYELMLIPPYEYGAVVNYNMAPTVPGSGSAIFIHVWGSDDAGTAGCIAFEKHNVLKILQWLDKNQHPYIKISAA